MKTSVIFPARNEEILVKNTLEEVYKYIKKKNYSFEILVIENGSTDRTKSIVKKLQEKYKEIILVQSKTGYGHALRKGMAKAKGEYSVIFNIDFYDLKLLDLIDVDLLGKDLVIGSKTTYWASDQRPIMRRTVTKLFNLYLRIIHGFKGSDTHGIKVVRKEVINKVLNICRTSSGIFDSEFVIKVQKAGYKIMEFPVSITEKRRSTFKGRLFQTPKDIFDLYRSLK